MYNIDDMYDYSQIEMKSYSIEDSRKDLRKIVDYFRSMDYHKLAINLMMVDIRQFPYEVADATEAFVIDGELTVNDLPSFMAHESLGMIHKNHITMLGRCVFPIKDVYGNVMGFIGWDPLDEPKYLDSKNHGYKAKNASFYGMEKLPEYYTNNKPVFLVEGIMCCIYLRWKGFQAIASLGSWLTSYQIEILKRFGSRLVLIADNDEAGNKYINQVKYKVPKALRYQIRYGKDVDGCRKYEYGIYEQQLLKELSSISNPFVKTELMIRR